MKKERKKRIIQGKYKFLIGLILGLVIASGGVYATTSISGSSITYSNKTSGLSSTNVQGAIDELYEKSDIRKADRFVAAYIYSESGSDKCITGEESTCERTTCYKDKRDGSCRAGTIIFYKVNNLTIVPFHVMFDNGNTMIMQSQRNTIYNTAQYDSNIDDENGLSRSPLNLLTILENATLSWSNVNDQTYTAIHIGERTSKVRAIKVEEAQQLGCQYSNSNTCPMWMYNYLQDSERWGLTSDSLSTAFYNTMDHNRSYDGAVSTIYYNGSINDDPPSTSKHAARAVVEVSK